MAKCSSESFTFRLDQVGKLKNDDIVLIDILDDLSSCAKINTRTAGTTGTGVSGLYFNAANVPEDAFGCSKNKCYNTGTLQGVATATAVTFPELVKTMDATLYAAGLMTGYALLPETSGTAVTINVTIADYYDAEFTNADTYSVAVTPELGAGLYPFVIDLGTEPTSTEGNGWTPSTLGVRVKVDFAGVKADDAVGISSFAFYESIEDLQIDKTVIVSCIDSIGDSQSFDVVEGACSTSEFDPNSGSMTGTITANKVSGNFWLLNPTAYTDDVDTIGVPSIVTRTVTAETINGTEYGVIQLSDMVEDECGFIYIQTPGCANNATELIRVSSPQPVAIDATQYQVLSTASGLANLGKILVSKDWVGQELNIVYRKAVDAEVIVVKDEFKSYHVRMIAPLNKKDGSTEYHVYENVLLTSFANNISRSSETTVELQFNVAADENGVRKYVVRPTEKYVY